MNKKENKKLLDESTKARILYHAEEYLINGNMYDDGDIIYQTLRKKLHSLGKTNSEIITNVLKSKIHSKER